MKKDKYFTNQELFIELEKRLAHATQDEFMTFLTLLEKNQGRLLKILQVNNPRIYQWCQEKSQLLEQEKIDKEVEKIKKALENKKDQ